MVINHELKFIFVHVPKTAGQTIWRSVPRPRHKTWPTHERLCNVDKKDMFAFGFVRNPWDRMVSLYHFMVQKPVVRDFDQEALREMGFKKALIENKLNNPEDAFHYLDGCDFIGRFEHLNEDFDILCERFVWEKRVLGCLNASSHDDYRIYYDNEMIDFIYDKHITTIAKFGYTFENRNGLSEKPYLR